MSTERAGSAIPDPHGLVATFTYRSYAATKREEDTGIPLMMAA